MILAGHQTMMAKAAVVAPTQFRFVVFKVAAHRGLRSCSSLSAFQSSDTIFQLSELNFINQSNSSFSWPSGMTVSNYTAYNGERHYSAPTLASNYNSGSGLGRIFDGSTSTKWDAFGTYGFHNTYANVYDADTGDALMVSGGSYDDAFRLAHFGHRNRPTPVALVLDLGSASLDISIYSRWRFYNHANASLQTRTIVEGEILGSNDMTTWWRLDVFNNTSIPNTNYAVAYTGNLVARPGDIWFGLDIASRDWANGIPTN